MDNDELLILRDRLKSGDYNGVDIMSAWIAIEELVTANKWIEKAFQAYPNIAIDIEEVS